MTDSNKLDHYFTEKMVGETLLVSMGPSSRRPAAPPHGVALDLPGGKAELFGLAARSLLAQEPLQALAGRPFSLPALVAMRRRLTTTVWGLVALAVLAVWSVLLWFAVPWLQR